MKQVFPYSSSCVEVDVGKERVKAILNSRMHDFKQNKSQEKVVKEALENPIQSPRLRELAKEAKTILLITSDHTRPVPSKITLPTILEEIRSENPDIKIRILIATGFHRSTTQREMIEKFGEMIVCNEEIINHDCRDQDSLVFKGTLPSGGALWLNSLINWADLVISEGFIEPHFFAGFSGGRKSILPGIAGEKTVLANHCSKFIASSDARTGKLENNPIHKDMLFAAKAAGLAFIFNVVIDADKKIINAFAGNPEAAHAAGCEFVAKLAKVKAVEGDIVITSNGGYPLDQNIYQAVKGMTAAEACVKKNGVIIMVAACNDGHGGEEFYRWFANTQSPKEVADTIKHISQENTVADQWEAQILARILMKCKVIMVAEAQQAQIIRDMHMRYAVSVEEALNMADQLVGALSDVVIIPDGIAVIVE